MKRILLTITLLVTALAARAQTTLTIDITLGELRTSGGSPIANNSLLQLIASSDTTFAAPTSTSFVSGNDTLVASLAFDSSTYFDLAGYMQLTQIVNVGTTPITGQYLLVRWFPALTTLSSTPGAGAAYGQYGYPNSTQWVAPSAGGTLTLDATSIPAPNANASLTTPIPEPSTYAALAGLLALTFAAARRSSRNQAFQNTPTP